MERLLLTSTGFENKEFEALFLNEIGLPVGEIKVIFIPTAAIDEEARAVLPKCWEDLTTAGITEENILIYDLDRTLSEAELSDYHAIYVCGGSPEYLLERINQIGFKQMLEAAFRHNLLYVGVSAGSIVCGRNLPGNLGYFDRCIDVHCSSGSISEDTVALTDRQALWIKKDYGTVAESRYSVLEYMEKARAFIYRNARPITLTRWQYHFEKGRLDAVLQALSYYQNKDGGFGHALETDSFNPNSSPIQTWEATEILCEIHFTDRTHPIIQGILKYLESGADFSQEHNQWYNTVPSNNDYPHAIWWSHTGEGVFQYNPTACLAGFIVRFAEPGTPLYQRGCEIVKQAYCYFLTSAEDRHEIACFHRMYEYLREAGEAGTQLLDMEEFQVQLAERVKAMICQETEKWGKEYVVTPSYFISSRDSIFYQDNALLAEEECSNILERSQASDGSYPAICWEWYTDYKEFEIGKNWWKSEIIIQGIRYLEGMGKFFAVKGKS